MITITKEFTKEQLIEHLRTRIEHRKGLIASMHIDRGYRDYLKLELRSSEIALVSLEAEQVGCDACGGNGSVDIDHGEMGIEHIECPKCYAAPPAPVENTGLQRKAAIHDALCEKYNVESLTDFVDWQRNHIAELEAAPPAPVGHGEAAVMPDYPGYALTQRECFEAGKKARLAELVTTAYKLPDGWVACSERMPEDGEKVLTSFRGGMRTAVCKVINVLGHKIFVDELTLFNGVPADYWQPLPAAPQQKV